MIMIIISRSIFLYLILQTISLNNGNNEVNKIIIYSKWSLKVTLQI